MTLVDDEKLPAAIIFGCAGTTLSAEEAFFFQQTDPLGFILFARNCDTPDQVRDLVSALRDCVGRDDAPVMIDQEGGRVQRLTAPHWKKRPAQGLFARMAAEDLTLAREAASMNARLIAEDLRDLGIDVNCLPVLDVPVAGAHDIIGDRSFGPDPELVADLGEAVIAGLMAGGVTPVIKHLPGHGRARADSHLDLPRVDTDLDTLRETDFLPFRLLNFAPWAMTAHIVYEAIDAERPATLSDTLVQTIIRGEIGFQRFLVSDDITMKALSGHASVNAAAALDAGCDAALHCNGVLEEMIDVAEFLPGLTGMAWQRYQSARAMMPVVEEIDVAAYEAHLDAIIAPWR